MQRCFELAQMGAGHTAPNPMVGAVLVYKDTIIGEGYHQQYGKAHGEVNCINSVTAENKGLIAESSLYVSLEPCSHVGKTPACTEFIIKNKIPTVIIGCRDNNTLVDGKGITKLKAAGVNVITGVLERDAQELNKRFFTYHANQRPYIILKWAQSSNKKISVDSGKRILISNGISNKLVHQWRSEEAAILVGTNTAMADDPALTTRLWPGSNPLRLVIDMDLKLPASLNVFDKKVKTIVFNGIKHEEGELLYFYKIEKDKNNLVQILNALYKLEILSVIVEGGAKLLQSFIDNDLWDEARVITNTEMNIPDGLNAPVLMANKIINSIKLQADTINIHLPG